MKKAPLISVIMPVYRVEKYLARTLDCILGQTYKNLEIICIEDGSPDNSIEILRKYQKKYKNIIVFSQKNAGAGAARNVGIKMANGDYIHFMDSDDLIDPDFYEVMLSASEYAKADMSASGFLSENKYTPSFEYKESKIFTSVKDKIKGSNVLVDLYIWRYLFKKDFILKNKLFFSSEMIAQEESKFVLRAVKIANRIVSVPKVLYHYKFNEDSILNSRDPIRRKKMKDSCKVGRKIRREFAKQNGLIWHWRTRKLRKTPIIGKFFK
ncbi:MAG TPA: glycosyltransferase family 2 protein [Alphaproteobacteria bacterium]|nr:glycosyltransferase family 2 protein [Alphaproteobacteria bacterium]